jgi:hypothetical protein
VTTSCIEAAKPSANRGYRGIPFRSLRKLGQSVYLETALQCIVKVVNLFHDHCIGLGYIPGIEHGLEAYWSFIFVHHIYAVFYSLNKMSSGHKTYLQRSRIIGVASISYM